MEELIARLWRDGVGPEDRDTIATGIAAEIALGRDVPRDLAVFGRACGVPSAMAFARADADPAIAILEAAVGLAEILRTGDPVATDRGVVTLTRAVAGAGRDVRSLAARAWGDLVLGDVAVATTDVGTAIACYGSAAGAPNAPTKLAAIAAARVRALLTS